MTLSSKRSLEKQGLLLTNKQSTQTDAVLTKAAKSGGITGQSAGKLLTRGEAAILIGVSLSEFKRRESLGIYVPTFIGENGWRFFSYEYVSSLPGFGRAKTSHSNHMTTAERSAQSVSNYDTQIAAKIFQALDDGLSTRDIVKKLLIHPDTVKTVYSAWEQLGTLEGGGIQISAKALEIINNLPLPGSYPILNEEQLLANLQETSRDTQKCGMCKTQHSRICMTCAEKSFTPIEQISNAAQPPARGRGRPRKSA